MTYTILGFLLMVLQILSYVLIARALISWVDPRMEWGISRILVEITEPLISPLRRVIPPLGMFDVSYIVAIFLIWGLMQLIQRAMYY